MQGSHLISNTNTVRPCLNICTVFPAMGISIIKIRRSWDRLIFIMGIPILVRQQFYTEAAPLSLIMDTSPMNLQPRENSFEELSGPHINTKTVFPRYGDSHVKDKKVARPSYLWHGDPYTGKTTSLYWDSPLALKLSHDRVSATPHT